MIKSPITLLFSLYLSGILLGRLPLHFPPLPFFLPVLFSIPVFCLAFVKKSLIPIFFLPLLFIGFYNSEIKTDTLPRNHIFYNVPSKKVTLRGTIAKNTETYKNGERLYLNVTEIEENGFKKQVTGIIRLSFFGPGKTGARYGDIVLIQKIRLRIPSNFNNPGGFDYRQHLQEKGIFVTGSIRLSSQLQILKNKSHLTLHSLIYQHKHKMLDFLDTQTDKRISAILKTMVFGEKGAIPTADRDLFAVMGIAHILAVSGLHMGFVSAVFFFGWRTLFAHMLSRFAMGYFLLGYAPKLSSLCTIPMVLIYGIMVGNSASSTRASIMICVYLISVLLGRSRDIFSSMTLAAFLILLDTPSQIFDVGFQLSFAAVFCILYGYKRKAALFPASPLMQDNYLQKKIVRYPFLYTQKKRFQNYLCMMLFASFGTLPITAFYFYSVSLAGPLFNILAVPLAAIIVPATLFLAFLSLFFLQTAQILFILPLSVTKLLLYCTEKLAQFEWCSIRVIEFSFLSVVLYYMLFVLLLHWSKKERWRRYSSLLAMIFIASLLFPSLFQGVTQKGKLRVTFLDVGQGESIFIRFPSGKTMLVDGGGAFGDFNLGRWVVAPFLWKNRLRTIDVVIGTHPDRDHIGGLTYILKEFKVGLYIDNGSKKDEYTDTLIRKILAQKRIAYRKVSSGDVLDIAPQTTIEFFNPVLPAGSDNDMSIVTKITYNTFSILLTGDITEKIEKRIASYKNNLNSTVMSAPHHGSRYSSSIAFLKKAAPQIIIISAGKNNRFGHPHADVLRRFESIGIKIYRTDKHGAVTIISDGDNFTVYPFAQTR